MAYTYYENGNSKHGEFEVMRESTAELFGVRPMATAAAKEADAKIMDGLVWNSHHGVDYTKQELGLAEKKYPAGVIT